MKISRKLSIWAFFALVFTGGIVLFIHSRIMMAGAEEDLKSLGNTMGQVIEESLAHAMLTRNATELNKTLESLQTVEPISRIVLVNSEDIIKEGTSRLLQGKSLEFADNAFASPAGQEGSGPAAGEKQTFRWVQAVRNKPECHQCHSPRTKYNGAIVIDFSTGKLEQSVKAHAAKESVLFLSAFSGFGLFLFLLSKSIVIKRLNEVIDRIGRFRDDEDAVTILLEGDDEITNLCRSYNVMAESISRSRNELSRYAEELLSLAVSSHVVTAAPRSENIYEAICNVVIREMKVKMAWIGVLEAENRGVKPVAQCGFEDGYLSSVRIAWDDSPAGGGPTGLAIKRKTPQIVSDMDTAPSFIAWKSEAGKRGYRSSMALPLLSADGEVMAVLNLYSGEPGYFTRKRVRLFMIFANQAATAIENRGLMENLERTGGDLHEQLERVSRSQLEWRLTFDSIKDMISIHDRSSRIIKVNKAFAEHCGASISDLIGRDCHEACPGACAPSAGAPQGTAVDEQRSASEEFVDPKTNRTFQVAAFPYYSPEGGFLGTVRIARDVTDIKEKELRLIMSERLASLGQMASGLAHEINNPLASIAGCAEGLLNKVRHGKYDPALFEEYLEIVEEEIKRCKSITTGMLSFVRKTTYEKKSLLINSLLDKTLAIIGFQGRLQEVEVVRQYDEDLPAIEGSEGELRQVFLVLLTNALDAMENRGRLTLATAMDGDALTVAINDTGPGIAAEHLSRIFDPFYTTKSETGGTGLGLSIAHKIITNHGASIDVSSREGGGTTFTLTFPCAVYDL